MMQKGSLKSFDMGINIIIISSNTLVKGRILTVTICTVPVPEKSIPECIPIELHASSPSMGLKTESLLIVSVVYCIYWLAISGPTLY